MEFHEEDFHLARNRLLEIKRATTSGKGMNLRTVQWDLRIAVTVFLEKPILNGFQHVALSQ